MDDIVTWLVIGVIAFVALHLIFWKRNARAFKKGYDQTRVTRPQQQEPAEQNPQEAAERNSGT